MNDADPFQQSRLDRFDANVEFAGFKRKAEAKADLAKKSISRFENLEKHCSFFMMPTGDDTVQFSFGNRLMGRKDLGGKTAFEHGLSLVYSIGPTGEVAVIIYPFISTLGKVHEDHIFLALGRMSEHSLSARLKKDLADLVAYGYVSSIDAAATWSEKLRISYLRASRPIQIDGKFVPPKKKSKYVLPVIGWLTGMLIKGFVTALLKPVAILILLAGATYFGWDWLAKVK